MFKHSNAMNPSPKEILGPRLSVAAPLHHATTPDLPTKSIPTKTC